MGFFRGIYTFGKGGVIGGAVGAAAALLLAPGRGDEFQAMLRDRVRRAKIAGAEAEAETQADLIRRYRLEVDDRSALQEEEAEARQAAAAAVTALGLGLNAPGALAAQETALREMERAS